MPSRGFKCTAEITLEIVSSPGTWLPNRDDLYLTIEFFNQVKRTRLMDPVFPLSIHERFRFEKYFWPATDPQDVVEMLEDLPLTVELRQVTDVYLGGCLLAYLDANGRDFLYPVGSSRPACASGREAMLTRTVDFVGVSPKLEFSTYSVVEELRDGDRRGGAEDFLDEPTRPMRRSRRSGGNFTRQTLSAALRSRSPSPHLPLQRRQIDNDNYNDNVEESQKRRRSRRRQQQQQQEPVPKVDNRPPFVVRHVDKNIVGRTPKLHDTFTRIGRGPPTQAPSASPEQPRRRRRSSSLRRSQSALDLQRRRTVNYVDADDIDDEEFYDSNDNAGYYARGRMQPPLQAPLSRSQLNPRYNPQLAASIRHRVADSLRTSGHRLYEPAHRMPPPPPADDLMLLEQQLRRSRLRDTTAY